MPGFKTVDVTHAHKNRAVPKTSCAGLQLSVERTEAGSTTIAGLLYSYYGWLQPRQKAGSRYDN